MNNIKEILDFVSFALGVMSAILGILAARVSFPEWTKLKDFTTLQQNAIIVEAFNSLKKQSKYAYFAAVAAGLSTLIAVSSAYLK